MSDTGAPPRAPANFPKQAVVVIHGMGEQIPMGTIKDFVRAAWTEDEAVWQNGMPHQNEIWSKPDLKTGSLELRRLTTRQSTKTLSTFPDGARTDFYELYWADLNAGSTLSDLENWVFGLLCRNPFRTIPPRLIPLWAILWLLSLLLIYLALMPSVKPGFALPLVGWRPYGWLDSHLMQQWNLEVLAAPVLAAAAAYFLNQLLVPTFGRVVRYTRATPNNIAARKAIRERGLALLNALHDGTYQRIIVVGHSLGSILGYDLISYFWASRSAAYTFARTDAAFPKLLAVERATEKMHQARTRDEKAAAGMEFEKARRALARRLRNRPKPKNAGSGVDSAKDTRWLITDFITLGSPLTHCEFLLNSGRKEFEEHKRLRELPTAPPVQECMDPPNRTTAKDAGFPQNKDGEAVSAMSFPFRVKDRKGNAQEFWQLHHAAPFAVVRWTNLYDPAYFYLFGDIISGPVAGHFGPAVRDINLRKCKGPRSWFFSHTKYWALKGEQKSTAAIDQLRAALNLRGKGAI